MEMNNKTGLSSPMDLIPRGYLCWAQVEFRGMKVSPTTGSRYADVALTIADKQPYARKKIFTKIGDPDHPDNSAAYRQMGMTALTRMVEAAGLADPNDNASYEKFKTMNAEQVLILLEKKYVAIKVKVEPGQQGYEDKNDVGEFLTPNAASQAHRSFVKLTSGDHGITASPVRQGAFAATPQVAPPTNRPATAFAQTENPPAPKPAVVQGFNPNAAPAFLKAGQPQ
jgi:hypothetical protein